MSTSADDQADIRRKLEQIRQVVKILESLDVADLPYREWLQGQADMNHPLTGANQTELELKGAEIAKLKNGGDPDMATVLKDEEAELAIMQGKMRIMTQLQSALDSALSADPGQGGGLDQQVADLINTLSQDELKLKQQQVATLGDRIAIAGDSRRLKTLQDGEQYEVRELEQICPLNAQIADLVRSGGDSTDLASLRRRVAHHELLMKQQNMKQLEARLGPTSS